MMDRWIFRCRQRHNGDPLKPSRLLFRCPDTQLAKRVEHHIDLPPGEQPPAWTAAWQLKTGLAKRVEHLSPTSSGVPACPYRFYLRHVQGMESQDFELGSRTHVVLDLSYIG